jgi:hypothetical protein
MVWVANAYAILKPSEPAHVWSRNGVGSTGEGAKFLMNMDGTVHFRRNV